MHGVTAKRSSRYRIPGAHHGIAFGQQPLLRGRVARRTARGFGQHGHMQPKNSRCSAMSTKNRNKATSPPSPSDMWHSPWNGILEEHFQTFSIVDTLAPSILLNLPEVVEVETFDDTLWPELEVQLLDDCDSVPTWTLSTDTLPGTCPALFGSSPSHSRGGRIWQPSHANPNHCRH